MNCKYVDDILAKVAAESTKKLYQQVNQALSRGFFSVFSENLGNGIWTSFRLSIMHVSAAAGFLWVS